MERRDEEVTRREFLKRAAAGAAAAGIAGMALGGEETATSGTASASASTSASATASVPGGPGAIPLRPLGKTGLKVSQLGFGGGSRFLVAPDGQWEAMLERAVAAGITYFDTAAQYGKQRASEKRYGRILPRYRKSIVLATKTQERSYDGAMRSVEESLKTLATDHLDLIQMHAAGVKDDPAAWEKPDGALTALRKLRDQKVVRFIGFTGHESADVHKHVIESLDFDTVLMALNASEHKAFRQIALPAAEKKGMGIIAMKTTKGLVGTGPGKATAAELLSWIYALPVSTAIVGMESLENLEENIRIAKAPHPAATTDVAALTQRLVPHVTPEQLGWAMPGYMDA